MIRPENKLIFILSDVSLSWAYLPAMALILVLGLIYFLWTKRRLEKENKSLSDKLSERSYQVMLQKWELERKNLSISHQNKEIIESLQYARNIQHAILPKAKLIARYFSDVFILYKPKDIVSGDFYFFEIVDDRIYLAVADCTGHGVAGAFMSMVGSSLLHQIIGQKHVSDPAEVLKELNEGIVNALQQKDSSSHGGMDIALISLDPKKNELSFAGANRPLFFIRDGKADSVSPDKLPIGGFQPEEDRRFTKQVMATKPGDHYYFYTDGYADQFGGPNGKKIMTKVFKERLLAIHQNSLESQQKELDSYFENWKGKYEQVDDVLVLGIKI